MRIFDTVVHRVSQVLGVTSAVGVVLIMTAITATVVARATTGRSIQGSYELVETVMVVVAFLGLAYAERDNSHVRVTLVTNRVSPLIRRVMMTMGNLACLVVVIVMARASWGEAFSSWNRGEVRQGLADFPLWPARFALALGLTALALELAVTVYRTVRGSDDRLKPEKNEELDTTRGEARS